jgi:hypothetical protein
MQTVIQKFVCLFGFVLFQAVITIALLVSEKHNTDLLDCEIWLAPSTIPGAGLGMYAGRDYLQGDTLLPCGDSLVPIIDYAANAKTVGKDHLKFLWNEYVWDSQGLLANEEGRAAVDMASAGFGSAANSFLPIYNVIEWYGKKDTAGLHRSRDPGAGAFSPYYDRKATAKQNIHAGQELFVSCKC